MDRGSTHISRHDREVDRKGGKGGVTTGFMVQGSGFRVQGSGFRVQGSGWERGSSDQVLDRHPKP